MHTHTYISSHSPLTYLHHALRRSPYSVHIYICTHTARTDISIMRSSRLQAVPILVEPSQLSFFAKIWSKRRRCASISIYIHTHSSLTRIIMVHPSAQVICIHTNTPLTRIHHVCRPSERGPPVGGGSQDWGSLRRDDDRSMPSSDRGSGGGGGGMASERPRLNIAPRSVPKVQGMTHKPSNKTHERVHASAKK
jgi:hypothetical protein